MSAINDPMAAMSTADANAEVVRRAYQALNEGDIKTLAELFDEKSSWHTPGRGPAAGNCRGRAAVFTQFGRYCADTNGSFMVALQHVLASDDGRVVGIHHNSAERNGRRLDVGCCIVFQLKGARIVSGREHFFDLYAWDEFWA